MSLKIGNSLTYLIGMELVVFLGVFFYTLDTFWFSAGLTITLMLFNLLIVFKIFSTSSNNPQVLGGPSLKAELTENLSEDTMNKTKEDLTSLKEELLLMPDEDNISKVLEIRDQFISIIQEIKSKIDLTHDKDNNIQLTQKIRDIHISDIEKIFKSEIENFNQNLPVIEKSVQSKINDLELKILDKIDLNFEKTVNMINNSRIDEEIQVGPQKSSEEKLTPEEDKEAASIGDQEKVVMESTSIEEEKNPPSSPDISEETDSADLFDVETETIIEYVSNRYSLIRYEAIELLQTIEKKQNKTFSNKEFMRFFKNNFYELNSMIALIKKNATVQPEPEDIPEFEEDKKDGFQDNSQELPFSEKFTLIGRENDVITINQYESQIKHNESNYKIQKNMGGNSLEDLKTMEGRVEKFFKNREILIVYCIENEKYFIYYK